MSSSNRQKLLDKRFNDVLNDKVKVDGKNARIFLEAICAQDSARCVQRLIESSSGLPALQLAMRHDTGTTFLNGQATDVLLHFFKASELDNLFEHLLIPVVDPPVFWTAFVKAFDDDQLDDRASLAFAEILLRLLSFTHTDTLPYRTVAQQQTVQDRLINSSDSRIKEIGYQVHHICSTYKSSKTPKGVASPDGPGGRHDNDFADFRSVAILPTGDEILSRRPAFLRPGAFLDEPEGEETRVADYLDNTFRLLREDMVHEMREEVQITLGKKKGRKRGVTIENVELVGAYTGKEDKTERWGIKVKCNNDFKSLKNVPDKDRLKYLENDSKFLKHQSLVCIIDNDQLVAFANVNRVEKLLAEKPPVVVLELEGGASTSRVFQAFQVPDKIKITQIDVAVFAFDPVLKALQRMQSVPLADELLFWKDREALKEASVVPTRVVAPLSLKPDTDIQPLLETPTRIVLDKSQSDSLLAGLTQRVSLIQGPPGTGKSFIGALLAKAIHKYTEQKILVVCYTNHALDQFLEDLIKIGISEDTIIRLGGRANSEMARLGMHNRRQAFRRSKADWTIIDRLKQSALTLRKDLERAVQGAMASRVAYQDLLQYLEFEDEEFFAAFEVSHEDDDGMTRVGADGKEVGPEELLYRWHRGYDAGQFKDDANVQDARAIWEMSPQERLDRIAKWKEAILKQAIENVCSAADSYNRVQDQLLEKFSREPTAAVLKGMRIIGCTTTGAAKLTEEIRQARPDVLLVEEAGEILESHVLTSLGESVSQMILIGDHKQLRPKVNNYLLTVEKGEGYELNRSLFERLVLRGYPHHALSAQHRMRPEISAFIRALTYPDLRDAPKTIGRANIRGVQNNIVFIDHSHPEDTDTRIADKADGDSSSSKQNTYEVQMILKIVRYLAQQGYKTDDLVLLTPYLGQMSKMRDLLKKDCDPVLNDLDSFELIRAGILDPKTSGPPKKRIRIATIDNYQGEESDIVIASLTRSNQRNDIGFMDSPERVNVLLSRARNGLILIGNSRTFLNTKKKDAKALWSKFFKLAKDNGHMYEGFPVKCERHPDRTATLSTDKEFDEICPDGGCAEACDIMLSCGIHKCKLMCHAIDDHATMKCLHQYSKKCDANRHNLRWKCHQGAPEICKACEDEEKRRQKELEEKIQRELQREEEQEEHDKRMAELEAKKQAKLDALADAELKRQRDSAYNQKEKDVDAFIANVRNNRVSVPPPSSERTSSSVPGSNAPPPRPVSPSSQNPPGAYHTSNPAHPPASNPTPTTPVPSNSQGASTSPATGAALAQPSGPITSPSHLKWLHLKRINGEKNEAIDKLMAMTGLEDVKAEVMKIKAHIDLLRRQNVPTNKERLNLVLLGNPGTGKTTVARLYSQFLESIKVLPGDAFIETTGSSLAHEGVGGAKTMIQKALSVGGGAIFIDEAYQLVSEHQQSGSQVLDFLLAEMENRVGTLVFILAGYTKQMEKFFDHNPGLPSRVPYSLTFADYTDAEFLVMLEALVVEKYSGRMKIEDGMQGLYVRIAVRRLGRGRGREGFGNARALQNMFTKVCQRQAERVEKERMNAQPTDDFLLLKEDLIGPDPSQVIPKCKPWQKLQGMTGLESVKDAVRTFIDLVNTNYHRELQEKEPLAMSLNRVFLGSPGTGKTTVAKLYGQILCELGLLSNGEVVVKNPGDFVGAYLGHSEKNTKAILSNTVGKSHQDSFKTAVIDTMVAEIQSVPGEDRCVLLLGYKEQMEEMFQNVNPGLASRFRVEDAFTFNDFTEPQLMEIMEMKMKTQDLQATDHAKSVAQELLSRAKNRPNFGNGREVENMLSLAKMKYQQRSSKIPPHLRSDVMFEPEDFDPDWQRAQNAAANLQKLFQDLVGCDDIVQKLGNYQKIASAMKTQGLDMRTRIPTNFIFKGPPGTGKTTIARKFGEVYYDMGFLASSELIECAASDLVGKYVGHTGPQTTKLFEKALGKVLFVDEAYQLSQGHFAKEAIDTVVGLMTQEKFKNKLIIIFAGYEKEMNALIGTNPGLASRFSDEIILGNIPPQKCLRILDLCLQKSKVTLAELSDPTSAAYQEMESIIERMSRSPNWGNARTVVDGVGKRMIEKAFLGVASQPGSAPSLTADEAIQIMKDMLDQERQRSDVPRLKPTFASSANLPMASASGPAPPPPPAASSSSSASAGPPKPPPPAPPKDSSARRNQKPPNAPKPSTSKPSIPPQGRSSPSTPSSSQLRPPGIAGKSRPTSSVHTVSGRTTPTAPTRASPGPGAVRRDAGVSDEVWKQLQADGDAIKREQDRLANEVKNNHKEMSRAITEQKQRDKEAAQLEAKMKAAKDQAAQQDFLRKLDEARKKAKAAKEAREKAVAELRRKQQEEQKRRREIEEANKKLQRMGACPMGYHWIPQSDGWRCAGGSHFVHRSQLR
ncbi:P-loop containing nucleoside triphosphate hydrolase protein [Coniophora puteana RWD-64-598 SS2]|uniref:P-loop containing nucleoside triphosphate hydrolase protein n=1 Tax=Coniophora puteana (strain RWD-64-598) TaxID=741705 RepID=A0A5M3MEP1_CONPW|nr:P-loop containing nucleoside triphosphate hydrolase protein [Coniophora puteana RWD-64-598 SS2]EIW77517.1 P-loop containing nucleoside triphosphate hydrolase protein [Coniophora puteana RWD-64-598 SS2]